MARWRPAFPRELPSLGGYVLEWIVENLAAPDRPDYEPFIPSREQAEFIIRFYEVDRHTGRRVIRRGVLSRPRGWGKSPFLSALAIAEGLADVVGDGFGADGRPVGRPWSSLRTPLVQVAASSEAQTKNSWTPLLEMLGDAAPVFDSYPGLERLDTFINLPRGRIEPITSSATSAKGNRPVFAILDQTEEWLRSNGGVRLAETMLNNATKTGGSVIETPNAYTQGQESVAESTAATWRAQVQGRSRRDRGLLYDHREAPPETDMADEGSLVAGLRVAYGDSSDHVDGCVIHDPPCPPGWVAIDGLVARVWDLDANPQTSRADFLNQITEAGNAWVAPVEWAACADPTRVVADGEVVTLGFDGSRGRARGKADATALIGCRVQDGHLFEVGVWEQPDGSRNLPPWEPPEVEVDAAVHAAFRRWRVVGFYGDPSMWDGHMAAWEAKYAGRLKIKATLQHPIRWPKTAMARVVGSLERLRSAITLSARAAGDGGTRSLTHDGSFALTRHVLNARLRETRGGLFIAKEHPDSTRKIDSAYAAMLAWQARLDAIAAGLAEKKRPAIPRRIR